MKKKTVITAVVVIVIAFATFCGYWLRVLTVAHSSFDDYYRFRGCQTLLEKTDTYGTCVTSSGQTIKIVLYQGKWYLDGDLPGVR